MSNKAASIYAEAMKQNQTTQKVTSKSTEKTTQDSTSNITQSRTHVSDKSRDNSRESIRKKSRKPARQLPTRDEVQELTFRLRDSLNVKAQAEIPHGWQDELNTIAHDMNVKKLELYRFIFAEFLGKVTRKT